jgi:hypothetical protein
MSTAKRPALIVAGYTLSVIAKAFHALKHGELNADQRGRLMLALGNLTDRVAAIPFAKALPTARQLADPNVRRRTAAQVAADLEKVEHALKGAAAHSHMKAATDLIDEASACSRPMTCRLATTLF